MMLAADVHLGTKGCDFQMERYVFKRRSDGAISIISLIFFSFSSFLCTIMRVCFYFFVTCFFYTCYEDLIGRLLYFTSVLLVFN